MSHTWIERLNLVRQEYYSDPATIGDVARRIENAFDRLQSIGAYLDVFDTLPPSDGQRDKWHTLRIKVQGFDAVRSAMIKNEDQDFAEEAVGKVLDLGMQMRSKAVELNGGCFTWPEN